MAKNKRATFVDRLEKAAGDVADAVSVAATGSQIGMLELAAEDELGVQPLKPRRKRAAAGKKAVKKKAAAKKKTPAKKPAKKAKRKKSRR